jgi:hypothetical protein
MSAEYPPKDELRARAARGDQPAAQALGQKVATGGLNTEQAALRPSEPKRRRMSALAMRLANRLGMSPDELVKEWPDDTLRRTKYPAVEEPQEDGSVLYKENPIR